MQYPKITLAALLLPSALALPSTNNGHGHGFKHKHSPYKSGGVSGAPLASGTGGPFGLNNATSSAAGTGADAAPTSSNTLYTTLYSTIYQTVPASGAGGAPAESATAVSEAGASNCAAPVTVTYNPTVTVTIAGNGNGGAPAESGVQSARVASSSSAAIASASSAPAALETSAPVVSSVTPVVASASSAPAALETSAPVIPSVAPVVFSSAAAPESSQAPASTQAASSAPVASSVAPVQSVSASPIGLAPQPVAASPSIVASSTPAAATGNTAAPASGPGSTKRGMVIPAGGDDTPYLVPMVNGNHAISWVSSWYSITPPGLNHSTAEFVPQMYGLNSDNDWDKNAKGSIDNGTKHFLAFGEPETYTTTGPQLHQDAATAATNWKKWMSSYSSTGPVGSPCTLQSFDPDQMWQQQFLAECADCKIGFVAMHWVDKAPPGKGAFQAQGFMDVVTNYTKIAGSRKVWIDNIQASGANEDQLEFLKVIIPFLENNPKVERYAYWSPEKKTGTGFLNSDGSISSLGQWYATYPGH